jgi:hypothetical protein
MLFPKAKMGYTPTYQGDKTDEGWLVLDIGNMELEGVTKIYIDLRDIDAVKERKTKESKESDNVRRLLGG